MSSESTKKRVVETVVSPNLTSIYANAAQIVVSPFDLRIHFGEIVSASSEKLLIEERAKIMLSPECARDLLRVLGERVKFFESAHGPIRELRRSKDSSSDS